MDRAFWLDRWEQNQIGFHEGEVNSHLQEFWGRLGVAPGSRIFVPLCGKSRDLLWLRAQGHEVFGVEWSPVAVRDFFAENGLTPECGRGDGYEECIADGIRMRCGDFFHLERNDLSGVSGVYDRASLIALPPETRAAYAAHLLGLLSPGVPVLLITLEYDQAAIEGPPFSVGESEVERLFGPARAVNLVFQREVIEENDRLRQRGLASLVERVYLLGAPS